MKNNKKTRTVYLVVKSNEMTALMQKTGGFEKFKFVGHVVEADQKKTHWKLSAKDLLREIRKSNTKHISTVGAIITNVGSAFLRNHTIYSNGDNWICIEELCKNLKAENIEIVGKRDVGK